MTPVMKITEALVVLFLVLFCYLFPQASDGSRYP